MTKTRLLSRALLLCAGLPLACSGGKSINIGNTNTLGSQLSDYAASWDGYAEAAAFLPDQTDRVRVTIDADGNGALEIGNAPTLPPPSNPNVGYPPSIVDNTGMFEGFLYPTHAAAISADRIQLGINPHDVYAAWCALQTPYVFSFSELPVPDGGTQAYGCLPNWGTGPNNSPDGGPDGGPGCALTPPDGGAILPVDCEKIALCGLGLGLNVCSCTASSCTSLAVPSGAGANQYPVELDAALDSTGKTLTGTLAISSTLRVTVVLTKQ
jgi:hypothetical protein